MHKKHNGKNVSSLIYLLVYLELELACTSGLGRVNISYKKTVIDVFNPGVEKEFLSTKFLVDLQILYTKRVTKAKVLARFISSTPPAIEISTPGKLWWDPLPPRSSPPWWLSLAE